MKRATQTQRIHENDAVVLLALCTYPRGGIAGAASLQQMCLASAICAAVPASWTDTEASTGLDGVLALAGNWLAAAISAVSAQASFVGCPAAQCTISWFQSWDQA